MRIQGWFNKIWGKYWEIIVTIILAMILGKYIFPRVFS